MLLIGFWNEWGWLLGAIGIGLGTMAILFMLAYFHIPGPSLFSPFTVGPLLGALWYVRKDIRARKEEQQTGGEGA